MKSFHENYPNNAIDEILDVWTIQDDLGKEDDSEANGGAIASAAFGMLGAASASNPLLSGMLGGLSSLTSVIANAAPPEEEDTQTRSRRWKNG